MPFGCQTGPAIYNHAGVSSESITFEVPAAASVPHLLPGPAPVPALVAAAPSHSPAFELAHPDEAAVWRATGREEPVFLDRRGRRRPVARAAAALAALGGAGWLTALVTGAVGFGTLPDTSVSGVLPAVSGVAPTHVALVSHATRGKADRDQRRTALDVDKRRHRRAPALHIERV